MTDANPALTLGFEPFAPGHLDGALGLSRAAGWPHRREDWALVLGLGQGVTAVSAGEVVGTAIATPFGPVGMLNMIIVARHLRGLGLGRELMRQAMVLATPAEWRLVATEDGLPLYRKLGFGETGRISQHQGPVSRVAAPEGIVWAEARDTAAIVALDRAATGMDRAGLLEALVRLGRIAVRRDGAALTGYAALRPFGRGEVAGPVIATDTRAARDMLAFLFAERPGAFLRVDTQDDSGLGPWLTEQGLAPVGGGVAMSLGAPVKPAAPHRSFALAAQALG
jgi:GNAT superfamily N-acetyltransferase